MSGRAEALEQILARRGRLTPRIVVEESRPESAPLHAEVFDRPPGEAAERYYELRAAQIIRSVHVTVTTAPDREPVRVRKFISAREDDDSPTSVYVPVEKVAEDPRLQSLVREQMRREWLQLKRKYEAHEEFWAMVRAETRAA